MKRAAVHRHGHDGPRHGRRAGPGRASRPRCTTSAPTRSSARRAASRWPTACSSGSTRRKADGGGITLRERPRGRARGRRLRDRGRARAARASSRRCSPSSSSTSRADAILASNTSGIPITKIAADLREPRARHRHALVEPAAPHPDDRGHPRREDQPGDGRRDLRARRRTSATTPVVEREVPGFVENRILYAILRECLDLVDRGIIDPAGLDTERALGHRLQARGDRPDGAARHGRARHLQGRRLVPEPGPVDLGRGLVDDPRPDRQGPARA